MKIRVLSGFLIMFWCSAAVAESIWGSLTFKIDNSDNLASMIMDYEFNAAWSYIPVQGEILYKNGTRRILSGVGKQVSETDFEINMRSVDSLNYVYIIELSLTGASSITERIRNFATDTGSITL